MTARETAEAKSVRLFATGAVTLLAVSPTRITAHVTGDHDRYAVAWTPVMGWHCECPGPRGRCSHLRAVQLVTLPGPHPTSAPSDDQHQEEDAHELVTRFA